MEVSLLCPHCTLVPAAFFDPARTREYLADVCVISESEKPQVAAVPQYGAFLVYSAGPDCEKIISENVPGEPGAQPEMFFILRDLSKCRDYNKILCTWRDSHLYMAIAQGGTLLLANVYDAPDFVTAEYYILLAVKSLQLNPEISTICWRMGLGAEDEMLLYRYFKSVERF